MPFLILFLLFFTLNAHSSAIFTPQAPSIQAQSYLLWDLNANKILSSQNEKMRLEPASLTKLMTAYLAFSALKNNQLQLDQQLIVSENAWKQEGSRMFLNVGKTASVDELLKGMIVQSGNDASVVLAEAIGGTENNFAQLMNLEAKRLGLKNSHFENATGLPSENHYSTAEDLALLARALIRDFPKEYAHYYALKEFTYNKITQPNRNRLLKMDPSVDGIKTGYTKAAGFCLIASAMREQRRLLSVVLGTPSEKKRISESAALLNWGFGAFSLVKAIDKNTILGEVRIYKGRPKSLKVSLPQSLFVLVPKGLENKVRFAFKARPKLIAPIQNEDVIGELTVLVNDSIFETHPVFANANIAQGGLFERIWDSYLLWRES